MTGLHSKRMENFDNRLIFEGICMKIHAEIPGSDELYSSSGSGL